MNLAQMPMYERQYLMHNFDNSTHWVGMLALVLGILLVILLTLLIVNNSNKQKTGMLPTEIIKERLAKGEISKQEYLDIKKEIDQKK